MRTTALALTLSLLALPASGQSAKEASPSPWAVGGVDVDAKLKSLTLEEKVGQMLFLGFGGKVMDDTIAGFLKAKKPGAVALFSRNIKSTEQTATLIREVRALDPAGIPIYISVDQEGGNVVRLDEFATIVPSAMALGAAGSEDLARRTGEALGKDLQLMGFNMNLAPVLDVNSNPNNPVIGIRSFGGSPELVSRMGVAFMEGMQSQGVSAVAKHFPGHGDTSTDSHFAMPQLDHDRKRLFDVELKPFSRALAEGLDALMTAHISLPRVAEEPEMPATVSKNVLGRILREDLGYDGLVITDGLEMEGIVSRYGSGEAAVRAVEAGADMVMVLWFPERKNEVHRALLDAVKSGRLPESRVDQSVRRILTAKARRGLFSTPLLPVDQTMKKLASGTWRHVADEVAERAITLVKNEGRLLPLAGNRKVTVASSEPGFSAALKRGLPGTTSVRLKTSPSSKSIGADTKRVIAAAKKRGADVVVVGVLKDGWGPLVKDVQAALPDAQVVVVSFGSPYMLSAFPDVQGYLCAFGFRGNSERAAARALLGDLAPTGTLPVDLPTGQRLGHGLRYEAAQR
jgi:beta-N-acetylhexosaminidase